MSNVLKHAFPCTVADGANALRVQPQRDWNHEHLFSGGLLGSLLYFDTGQSDKASWLAVGSAGQLLRSTGTLPAWSTLTIPNTVTQGDLVVGAAANVLGSLAAAAAGKILRAAGAGTVPAWSTLTLPDTVVQGDLLAASAANVLSAIAAVATGQVLTSAGAGTLPAWSASPSLTALTLSGALTALSAIIASAANGATWTHGVATELITLNTGAAFTDSVANLLPANSFIEAVVARITTTITTAVNWRLGDPTNLDNRFTDANATMTAGTTDYGLRHIGQPDAVGGQKQIAADKVRITLNANPGAGAVRVTVFYRTLVAPTS